MAVLLCHAPARDPRVLHEPVPGHHIQSTLNPRGQGSTGLEGWGWQGDTEKGHRGKGSLLSCCPAFSGTASLTSF